MWQNTDTNNQIDKRQEVAKQQLQNILLSDGLVLTGLETSYGQQ